MNPVKALGRAVLSCLLFMTAAFLALFPATASPPMQGNSCLNAPVSADPSPTVCISNVLVSSNGRSVENQFVVSWRTRGATTGSVQVAGIGTFNDVRGANFQGTTHYVVVKNLVAKGSYTFDVISDDETLTNGGAHWSVKLGAPLKTTTPYFVFGRVKNPDGSDADGALVYAQLRDRDDKGSPGRSALLSALIVVADGGDFFNIDLENARTQNNAQNYVFDPNADRVLIHAANAQGSANQVFDIADLHPPKPPPSLILNSNGTGNAATATPTLPATETPTATATFTETATAVPTATETLAPAETAEPSATPTPNIPPTFADVPTIAPDQATRLASTPDTTRVAIPAADEVEPQRTRIFGGVPDLQPPPAPNDNTVLVLALAVVLFVGAVLLGLAAFFVTRR